MIRRHPLGLLALCMTLASCGGGGSAPSASLSPASCVLPLQYANGTTSGIPISSNSASANRTFTPCDLAQVNSLVLSVCTDHPAPDELSGQLRLSGSTLFTFQSLDGTLQDTSCMSSSNGNVALRRYSVSGSVLPGSTAWAGPWSLVMTDSAPNNNQAGFFVAWRLEAQGLR